MKSRSLFSKVLFAVALVTCICFYFPSLCADNISIHAIRSTVLEDGDAYIHGLAYCDGYIWASTRTKPCRILRIDPVTLGYERIVLGDDAFEGEDLISADGALWIILYGPPSRVVRIDPQTCETETVVQFKQNELSRGGALVYAFDALWVGGGDGRMARIDLNDYGYDLFDFSTALGRLQIHSLAEGGGFLWASSPLYRGESEEDNESIVLRIDPRCPDEYAAVFLRNLSTSDDMAYWGDRLYLGSEEGATSVISIANELIWRSEGVGETGCNGLFLQGSTLWGAFNGEPGGLLRLNPESTSHDFLPLPEGLNHANELVFDPDGNRLYITCWENPTKIVRIDLASSPDPGSSLF